MRIAPPTNYDKEFSTGLFDCVEVCCSPLWCNALWCKGVVWGQILTRLKLSYWGARDGASYKHSFIVFVCLWIGYLVTHTIWTEVRVCVRDAKKAYNKDPMDECAVGVGLFAYLAALILAIMMCIGKMKARNYFRKRVGIKPTCYTCDDEGCVDDCLCVTFCGPCTAIQMIRETQQGHTYSCCHKTGYPNYVEEVSLFGTDDDEGEDTDERGTAATQNDDGHDEENPNKKTVSIGKQSSPSRKYGQLPANEEDIIVHAQELSADHHEEGHHEMEAEMTEMTAGVMMSTPSSPDKFSIV